MSPRAAIRIVSFLSVILGSAVSVPAAQLKEAQVTQVVKDVKLLPTGAAARPATVNDEVRDGIAVRTGVDSRSELTPPVSSSTFRVPALLPMMLPSRSPAAMEPRPLLSTSTAAPIT